MQSIVYLIFLSPPSSKGQLHAPDVSDKQWTVKAAKRCEISIITTKTEFDKRQSAEYCDKMSRCDKLN